MIGIKLRQTNGTMLQEYTIELAAAPFREVWFSTAHGLTSGTRPPPDNRISGGDLSYNSIDYNSLFAVGLMLFILTLVLNLVSQAITKRFREVYQ